MKRFLSHFTWTIIIGVLIFWGYKYQHYLEGQAAMTFNPLPVIIFDTIYPIIMGLMLRLPKFLYEIRVKKEWSIDWVKFAAVGLPSLYITLLPILYLTPVRGNFLLANEIILLTETSFTIISGVVFGYVLLDSLKK